tara:strand:- start:518 stop:727 length:210 start_codon:yes stop_codon:yes gene_type:complete
MSDFSEKSSSLLKANKYLSNEKKPIVSRPNIDHLIKRIIIEKRKEKKRNLLVICSVLIFGGLSIFAISN